MNMKRAQIIVVLVSIAFASILPAKAFAMYNPTLGRFMQRDPIAETATGSASGLGRDGGSVMRDPAIASPSDRGGYPDGLNIYQYVRSAPTSFVDPSGEVCNIAVRCGAVVSGQRHCGLVIQGDLGTYAVDGSGGAISTIGWVKGNASGWGTTSAFRKFDDSVCRCLLSETRRWNGLRVPRDHLDRNSNWTLKCLTGKCGLTIPWGTGGTMSAPIGWDCKDCVRYETLNMGRISCLTCAEYQPCACP